MSDVLLNNEKERFTGDMQLPFDPDPSEQAAIAQLVEEIQHAIDERGGA
jgi:hypothetical protein